MQTVAEFLLSEKSLNLTQLDTIQELTSNHVRINYLHGMWYQIPKKVEVIRHLDQGGPMPKRYARVVLVMGAQSPPVVREVLVDLPKASKLIPVPISGTLGVATLPFWRRPYGFMDEIGISIALLPELDNINAFFKEAFNGHKFHTDDDSATCDKCLQSNNGNYQYLSEALPRVLYTWFEKWVGNGDGAYLHPVPFQMLVVATGENLDRWGIGKVWFNFQSFDSMDALLKEWRAPGSKLKAGWKWVDPTGLFSSFKPRPGPKRGANAPTGPVPLEPFGRRFAITRNNKVEWLGWSLYVGSLPTSGSRLWDVRFKVQRIAYEISLQEALADYGGGDIIQANSLYLDSSWGIGASYRELLHGVDCPLNSAYMDVFTWYQGAEGGNRHKNSICVFEMDTGVPALRHYSYSNEFYGAIKSWALVIRSIAEVYNYDYIFDTYLYVDGTIETKVHTTGYIQASAQSSSYPARFGYPMNWGVGGTIHNHHLSWKVDLDIAGTQNSVRTHEIRMAQVDTGFGGKRYAHYYDVTIPETEQESAIKPNLASPKIPIVVNENAKNKWGSPRGYKVQVNRIIHELMPESEPWKQSLGFARYSFVATKHKDNETSSSSIYNQAQLGNPVVRFDELIGSETIRNQDIVIWVSSGLYHLPTSEDAPVTSTTSNNIGFSLVPFNYGDESLATDMADMVYLTKTIDKGPIVSDASRCQGGYQQVPYVTDGFEG